MSSDLLAKNYNYFLLPSTDHTYLTLNNYIVDPRKFSLNILLSIKKTVNLLIKT